MFAARCLGGSLAFFLVIYVAASLGVSASWRLIAALLHAESKRRTSDLLFALRVLPFGLASLLMFALCIPSFLLLEPHDPHETVGLLAPSLGVSCLLLLALGVSQAVVAHHKSSQAITSWLQDSSPLTLNFASLRQHVSVLVTLGTVPLTMAALFTVGFTLPSYEFLDPRVANEGMCLAPLILAAGCLLIMSIGIARALLIRDTTCALAGPGQSEGTIPVFQTSPDAPSLTVAGIRAPKVLVSASALATLNESELQSALRHEVAHMDAHDNLKKLVLRFLAFPGMARLERAWSDAAEMAADEAAVSNLPQALDLASALIKISRLAPVQHAALASGFSQSKAGLSARVQRLFEWKEPCSGDYDMRAMVVVSPACVAAAVVVAFYTPLLFNLHAFMEWLLP